MRCARWALRVARTHPPLSPSLFFSHTGGKSGTGGLLRPQTCRQLRLPPPTPLLRIKMNPERHVLLTPQEIYRVNLLDCLKSFVDDISLEGGELPTTVFRDMITRRNKVRKLLSAGSPECSILRTECPTHPI